MVTHWLPLALSLISAVVLVRAARCGFRPPVSEAKTTGRRARIAHGGVVLLGSVLLTGCVAARTHPDDAGRLAALLGLAGLVWLLGLSQDVLGTPWWVRDAGIAVCASWAFYAGVEIQSLKLPLSSQFCDLGIVPAALITVLWIVLVTDAFLATRALPGLTTGLGSVAALTFGIVSFLQPQEGACLAAALTFSIAGACLGLHLTGRSASGLATGASGSALVGFVLGMVTILAALKNTAFLIVVFPLLVFGAPLLNTTYAVTTAGEGPASRRLALARRLECLHEALLRQRIGPERLVAWFIGIDVFLCALAVLLVLLIEVHFAVKLLIMLLPLAVGGIVFWSLAKLFGRAETETPAEEVRLFDVRFTPVSMGEALDRIDAFVHSREPHHIVTSDSSAIVKAQSDSELHQIIDEAALVTADGVGVIWSARLLDVPLYERVPGVDLVAKLCERGSERDYRFFFLGAEPGVTDEAAAHLTARFPGLQIVGTHHGYFSADEEEGVVEQIRAAGPDILLVAMGIPRQEKWIRRHVEALRVPVCIGVGGTFDVFSGRVKRAPEWVQRCGLEWLYRGLIDPSRLLRLLAIPRFIAMTLGCRFRRWKRHHAGSETP